VIKKILWKNTCVISWGHTESRHTLLAKNEVLHASHDIDQKTLCDSKPLWSINFRDFMGNRFEPRISKRKQRYPKRWLPKLGLLI
jgi:hypothetical protein